MSGQQAFVDALFDFGPANQGCPSGLVTWNRSDPAHRFAVYRNNVMISLIDALADGFPVTQELVGEAFFRGMARQFAIAHPPRSRILAYYGRDFPTFIETFLPAASLPYLADVARLEMLRVLAYHAADRKTLTRDEIGAALADGSELTRRRLVLHPSVAVLQSNFAVVSLWGAHQGLGDIAAVDPAEPQTALVVRIGLDVNVVGIGVATGCFIGRLIQGATLADAAAYAAAASKATEFDLVASLGVLLRWQTISEFREFSEFSAPGASGG